MSSSLDTAASLRKSLATLMETAKGSQPADPFVAQAWEMAGAHAFMINALLDLYEVRLFLFWW